MIGKGARQFVENPCTLKSLKFAHPKADIWLAFELDSEADYFYGGTRMVAPGKSETEALAVLENLAWYESGLKNRLINWSISRGILDNQIRQVPNGLRASKVLGGRCVFRPKTRDAYNILSDPTHIDFSQLTNEIFSAIGEVLNQIGGKVKLTPDFGRYAHLADTLAQYTPHSLGIRCADGGCGGKSSYTATGIIQAYEILANQNSSSPAILIGSAGALGSEFFEYLKRTQKDHLICDIVYDSENKSLPAEYKSRCLRSEFGKFTNECLSASDNIIATTVGNEIENSDISAIRNGALLLAAHNHSLPAGSEGIKIARMFHDKSVLLIPGQVLTLGGALTSRIEWFWRQSNPGMAFDKLLAHDVVRAVTRLLINEMMDRVEAKGLTPLEAVYEIAAS